MNRPNSRPIYGRRSFLKAALLGSALLGLGGPCQLRAFQVAQRAKAEGQRHKFLADSGLSFEEIFIVAYIPPLTIWRSIEREIGREKLHEMMRRAIDLAERQQKAGKNDLATYTQNFRKPDSFYQNVLTFQIIEDTPRAFEVKISECLWAKTYREANAGDLGYIFFCYADFASTKGFNPKMRMIRTKTLMQGDDCCNNRYVTEE